MKFSLAIEKKNRTNIGQAEGHNARHHATQSQLPNKDAWLTPEGLLNIKPWAGAVLDQARALAKRKDAVLAIELVVQVGDQTHWREMPDDEHPQGKPKRGNSAKMNALLAGVRAAVKEVVGWDRVISADLHTDESSPHVHIVFAPILDGKLQAKNWVGGAAKCAQLRQQIHAHVTKHLECEYTKGAPGGEPHDPEKAAGRSRAVNTDPLAPEKTTIQKLQQQVQTLFSQLKAERKKASKLKAENDDFTLKMEKLLKAREDEIDRLTPKPSPLDSLKAVIQRVQQEAPPPAPSGRPGLRPGPAGDRP